MAHLFDEVKDDPLFSMLMSMRKRPAMWLGEKSLKSLINFINGYMSGKNDFKEPYYYPKWYQKFKKYVAIVCVEGNECYGIANAIFKSGYDDCNGVDRFYELLDDFCADRYNVNLKEYMSNKEECLEKLNARVNTKEAKVICVGQDAINEAAYEYISNHFEEIFDLYDGDGFTRTRYFARDKDNNGICRIYVYNDKALSLDDVRKKVEEVGITAKTIFGYKPYVVVKLDEDK